MEAATIRKNGEALQTALTRLAELAQQAEQEQWHGRIGVSIEYQQGTAKIVRRVLEGTDKVT